MIPLMLLKIILYLFDMICDHSPTIYSSGSRLCFETHYMVCHLFVEDAMDYEVTESGKLLFKFSSAGSLLNDSFMCQFGIVKIPSSLSISRDVQYEYAQKLCSKVTDSESGFCHGRILTSTTIFKENLCEARIIVKRDYSMIEPAFYWMVVIREISPMCVHQRLKIDNKNEQYCFAVITDPQTATSIKWDYIEIE